MRLKNNTQQKATQSSVTLVTEVTDINQFDYLIIGKSFDGLYINGAFNGDNWSKPLHNHLINANCLLSQCDDTLETVLMIGIDTHTATTFSDVLVSGYDGDTIAKRAFNAPLTDGFHEVLPHAFHTDKPNYDQPSNVDMAINPKKFDHYLSYVSQLGLDVVKVYNGYGYDNFQQVSKETALHNRLHNDQAKVVMLSRGTLPHVDIIQRLQDTRQRILNDDIEAFIS